MKILTVNFLTCAVKACKASPQSFPLHFRDAELEQVEMDFNAAFLHNILPRIEWDALRTTAAELGFTNLPETKPAIPAERTIEEGQDQKQPMEVVGASEADNKLWRDLHRLLLETQIMEGKMVCGNCGHEYRIKEGIPNFLLPSHLV